MIDPQNKENYCFVKHRYDHDLLKSIKEKRYLRVYFENKNFL